MTQHARRLPAVRRHSVVPLSFEAVGALRETTERGFSAMRADHEQKFVVLHRAVTDLGQRVAALERQNR